MSFPPPPGQPMYPPPPPPMGPPMGPGPSAPNEPSAILALVLGIVGLTLCQLAAPFAWSIGQKSERAVDASGGQYGGRGMATAGKIMGIVGTVLLVLVAIFFVIMIIILIAGGFAASELDFTTTTEF